MSAVDPFLSTRVARRIGVLGVVLLGLLAVLIVRLWFLQVIGTDAYAERAEANRLRTVVVEPPRGRLLDREGRTIVGNRPSMNVVARPRELTGERRRRVLRRLAPVLGVPYPELRRIVEAGDGTPYQSVVIAESVSRLTGLGLMERQRQFAGIAVVESSVRDFRQTPAGRPRAAHVVGYLGAIGEEDVEDYRARGYLGNERVGVAGAEARYESYLRGTPGGLKVEVDADGQPVGRGVVSSEPPRPGSDVQLALDLPTQAALEEALREYIALSGLSAGAAGVALDPRTGEVLALASFPTFDASAFAERRPRDIARTLRDPRTPLLDRATAGRYPAASTFRPATGSTTPRRSRLPTWEPPRVARGPKPTSSSPTTTSVRVFAVVDEGRVAFDNVRKTTFFLLSTGVAAGVAVLASVFGRSPRPSSRADDLAERRHERGAGRGARVRAGGARLLA